MSTLSKCQVVLILNTAMFIDRTICAYRTQFLWSLCHQICAFCLNLANVKRNEMRRDETKVDEMSWDETRRDERRRDKIETKRKQMKRNETNRNKVKRNAIFSILVPAILAQTWPVHDSCWNPGLFYHNPHIRWMEEYKSDNKSYSSKWMTCRSSLRLDFQGRARWGELRVHWGPWAFFQAWCQMRFFRFWNDFGKVLGNPNAPQSDFLEVFFELFFDRDFGMHFGRLRNLNIEFPTREHSVCKIDVFKKEIQQVLIWGLFLEVKTVKNQATMIFKNDCFCNIEFWTFFPTTPGWWVFVFNSFSVLPSFPPFPPPFLPRLPSSLPSFGYLRMYPIGRST